MADDAGADQRVNVRLTQAEADLLDETQGLLQRYIARNAKKYAGAFRVTQRIVIVQAIQELHDRLGELLRER